MKLSSALLLAFILMIFSVAGYAQDTTFIKTQLKETPLENKHWFTSWRVDYYICTGIAYAKSLDQSIEDFAEFVGNHHDLGISNNPTLASAAQAGHFIMTSYPNGQYQIIKETDSVLIAKSNRPYKSYFKNGTMFGVTLDEFEEYFWKHVVIMHNKINLNFEYIISEDDIVQTVTYKK